MSMVRRARSSGPAVWSLLLVATGLRACGDDAGGERILFIRGGAGTAGFVEGGTDDHLSDIHDTSTEPFNRGFGQLAELLREDGFAVDQVEEGPVTDNTPVDLNTVGLSRYAVVVFGSNNATYDSDAVALVAEYIEAGGGALFASDANWGSFYDKAPSSDQTFLTQFGLIMNQDGGGRTTLAGSDLLDPEHPILQGIDAFEGEGVSPCSISRDPAALAVPVRLAITKEVVRRNTAPQGPVTEPTADDASLAVAEYGTGRIACHFDRNTFNENGAGTSLVSANNASYARNLFGWLAGRR
jgi:hypothetical protein